MTIALGTSIDGRYRVERLLGEGGMGSVYAVRDAAGAELALKVVLDGTDAVMCKRFVREAEAARALASEHATRVFASGTLEDGRPYMVMELLSGQDLHDHLQDHGALPPADAVDVVVQICDALGEAHELGMVHRDVKPANIFVRRRADGRLRAKLLDFGVSKPALSDVPLVTQLTQAGTLLGSPHYMSPEQLVSSRDVDPRADIWSLGATLYELLTGVGPFEHGTVAEVISAVLRDPPPPIRSVRPEVPKALEHVVMRCLEKDADQRFASAEELVAALNAASPGRAEPSPRAVPREPEPSSSVAEETSSFPRWWWGMAAFVIAGVVVTLWLASDGEEVVTGEMLTSNDEWIVGPDRDLDERLRERVLAQVKNAHGKLVAKKYDAARLLAADAEDTLVARGLVLHTDRSRLAQYAAIIQARAHGEQAIGLVRLAGKDDDPHFIIGKAKDHLRREAEHVKRAAAWDQHPKRCISMASASTQAKVLSELQNYMSRLEPAERRVAKNWESSLSLGARASYDELLHPSAELSEPCRKAVEKERRALSDR